MIPHPHVAIAIAAVGLTSIGAWLHTTAVVARHRHLDELQRESRILHVRSTNDQLQRRVDSMRDYVEHTYAIADDPMANLMEMLSGDLRDLDVKDRSLKASISTTNGPFSQTPLTLNFNGPFSAAFELLDHLCHDPRIIRIRQLRIDREPNRTAQELAVSLQLDAFAPMAVEAR